jgi:signal transduction histidine kinase/ligand-binding sensor domain-containing protein/DNA-binding NarL/FixJ family response regulator
MHETIRIYLIYFLLLTTLISISGQKNNLYFKHITSDLGLPANYVESIYQTEDGFIWFGSSDGLSRYDGLSFLNFRNNSSDTSSLIDNEIKCLTEDNDKRLWIGTQKGLTYLDLRTYKFHWFNKQFPKNIGNCWISCFLKLNNRELLIGTYGFGLFVFDVEKNRITGNYRADRGGALLSHNNVRAVCVDAGNKIWVATDGGLDVINIKKGRADHLFKGETVFKVIEAPNKAILATSLSSPNLYQVDPFSLNFSVIQKLEPRLSEKAKLFFFDHNGNKWLSISGEGLFRTDTQNVTHYTSNNFDADGLSSNNILTIFEDRDGNLWFGTFDAGVILLNKHRKPFIQVKSDNRKDGLLNNQVRSLFQDREGDVWVGTRSGGMLSRLNRANLTFINYKQGPGALNDDIIKAIADGQPGTIWVGTLTGGINILNKHTGKFSYMSSQPGKLNQIASNNITVLYNDNSGKIWIGHGELGLDAYDLKSGQIVHYSHTADSGSLSDNRVRAIFKDSQANLWVGTMHGLNRLPKGKASFERFLNKWNDTTSISGNNITCIYEDKFKRVWVGTTNGFSLWNGRTHSFKVFNRSNGFPGSSARGILDDKAGNLWISTENGLIQYNPSSESYIRYSKADGLNSNEFIQYAYCKAANGEMYFGTGNGFVIFNAADITPNDVIPNVVFTKLKVFNQDIFAGTPGSPLKNDITLTRELRINYKQSVFTLEFTALNYTTSENNQFAYKLEGVDNDWNYIGTRHDVTFTNLPAGNYTFRVKASNNDGIWNEKGTEMQISILPPPWKTWWAYSFYILLVLFILYKIRELTIKRIHEEKEHELDQMKLRLFMNVSHEFRTPLTLMLNPLEKINSSDNIEEIKSSVKIVERSSWKLLHLVNQLLDYRKTDLGKASLKARKVDIVKLSRQLLDIFEGLAMSREMKLEFESLETQMEVWIDTDKYEKIINNLLSNAFKFTDNRGRIAIKIGKVIVEPKKSFKRLLRETSTKEYAEIRVSDTGVGMKPDELAHIFESFYQVDHSKAGTGIGLNYAKLLIELHGGELHVESEFGKGSTFIIRLPLGREHLAANQIIETESPGKDGIKPDISAVESLLYDIENTDFVGLEDDIDSKAADDNELSKVVLIVEDNKMLRLQIKDYLEGTYTIKEASNGEEGLEKAQKLLPDLIISDIMMPKMDGIELCRKVKESIDTCHIPVILLTAKNTIENKIEGFETGADEYIPKPFSMELLGVRVKNLIQSRAQLKEKFQSGKMLAPASEYTTNNLDEAFLEKITGIVLNHIEDPEFSLSDLREEIGMGQTNFFSKLQSITGQNPSNFVRTIRLKYAAGLLLQSNLSIKDVCYKCGFNSPAYFTKTFRELYGQTPKEYIESSQKKRE